MTKKREPLHREDLCNTMEKPTWAPSDAVRMQGNQHLKGCTIYLLSVFFFLFYLIKTANLSYLLSGLSSWDPERPLHSLTSCPGAEHPLPIPPHHLPVHPPSPSLHEASQVPRKGQRDLYKEIEKYTEIL